MRTEWRWKLKRAAGLVFVPLVTMIGVVGCASQPAGYGEATRRFYPGMSMADATLVYGVPADISRQGGVTTARYHLDERSSTPNRADAFGINYEGDSAVSIYPLKIQER